jgi:fibro-slime domain-containing protein
MLSKMTFLFSSVVLSLAIISMAPNVQAQNYPDTLRVPVTFYDFHSDGSNPEFEKSPTGTAVHLGMVATRVNAQSKPVLGPTPYFNCDIAKWFVPWTSGDFTIPNYTNPATATCANPFSTVDYDTAFKNIVIQDTLLFRLINNATGTYGYVNASFFPLDGRGFGNEVAAGTARAHNYSFSMELHWQFKKMANMSFVFTGDDDVWAFIDSALAMDIGGIHNATTDSVILDNIPGLVNGQSYMLDFFYCERHVTASSIRITTNIISAPIVGVHLDARPKVDTLPAGDSIFYTGWVVDDTGAVRPEFAGQIQWTLLPQGTQSSITNSAGGNDTFVAKTAYTRYFITATFTDPTDRTKVFRTTDTVYIIPGPPTQVVIEADTVITDPLHTNPVNSVTMDSITNTVTVYAMLYDKYGNYVGKATAANWSSTKPSAATVAPAAGKNFAGVIQRQTRELDSTYVIAAQAGLIPDTVTVIIRRQETEIKSVCIVPTPTGDSLYIFFNGNVNWTVTSIGSGTLNRKRPGEANLTPFSRLDTLGPPQKLPNEIVYVFRSGTLVAYSDSMTLRLPVAPNARVFPLYYCHEVQFIKEVRVAPNPIILGETTIPENLRNPGDPTTGIRLEIIFANPTNSTARIGSVTIFDAVGNVVYGKAPMKFDPKDASKNKLYFIWDGYNKKGSKVAGGTYLAKFQAQDKNTGASGTDQCKIGIKTNSKK